LSGFKLSTLFTNERGFSLTEVMVGGGILAGVALASAQMFKDQKSAQRKVDNEQKLTIYHQGLSKNLSDASNCNATMKAAGFTSGAIPTGASITRIAKCTANCEEKDGDQDHKAIDVTAGADLATTGNFIDGTRAWKVLNVSTKSGRSTTGPVILKVDYQMNSDLVGGATKVVSKDIVVNARFDGGVFQECVNSQESNVNNLQSDFCKTLNYGNVSSTGTSGQLARWDEATQRCIIGTDKDCSAQGLVVDGIDSNGLVKCRKLSTKQTADSFQSNTSSASCGATQKASMQFDTATKRFKVVCIP
jgi:hypothetical protein